jgi:hypothetical protein
MSIVVPLATLVAHVGGDFFDYDKPLSGTIILPYLLGPQPAL